eukprot:9841030-Lingulodinium_polyedra.AAC.1
MERTPPGLSAGPEKKCSADGMSQRGRRGVLVVLDPFADHNAKTARGPGPDPQISFNWAAPVSAEARG